MVLEKEYSKSSAVCPESLISNKSSQNSAPNPLFADKYTDIKSEELCSSDIVNGELLYGNILSTDESFCSPNENVKEGDITFQETMSDDVFSASDLTSYDLYYDKIMSFENDFLQPMSDKFSQPSDPYFEANSPISFWGSCPLDIETLKMDDVFQVDKDDLVQSPTLAELNANDESLFDSFDNFVMALPPEKKVVTSSSLTSCLDANSMYKMPSLTEAPPIKTEPEIPSERTNLLLRDSSRGKDGISSKETRSSFNPKETLSSLPSKRMCITSTHERNVSRQIITKLLTQPYPTKAHIQTSVEKKEENVSEMPLNSDTFDSEDDSEMDCEYSSDVDEDSEVETKVYSSKQTSTNNLLLQKKKSRYFWQYNIQSKGPKAPKMKLDGKSATSNCPGTSDPVFSPDYLSEGIQHAGKARRGDGNDLTPNPLKLYTIGLELKKLTSVIEGLAPANELPLHARSKSRKEKNKLASRACRLKKKAQHEANKLKLFGLHNEQKQLQRIIWEVKKIIKKSVDNIKHGKIQSIHSKIESLCLRKDFAEVAGCSAEYVNNVLKNIDLGDKTGGLVVEDDDDDD